MNILIENSQSLLSEDLYFGEMKDKTFSGVEDSKENMILDHDSSSVTEKELEDRWYSSDLCEISISEVSQLKEPSSFGSDNSQTCDSGKEYSCGYCEESFSEINLLKEHIAAHTDFSSAMSVRKKQYSCGLCEQVFAERDQLKLHIRIHTVSPIDKRKYSCGLCEKSFHKVDDLKDHIRVHTTQQHFCEFCEKSFPGQNLLRQHLRMMHIAEQNQKIHAELNNLPCQFCNKTAAEHVGECTTVHFGVPSACSAEKPHPCGLCKKLFSENEKMEEHLRNCAGQLSLNSESYNAEEPYSSVSVLYENSLTKTDLSDIQIEAVSGLSEVHVGENCFAYDEISETQAGEISEAQAAENCFVSEETTGAQEGENCFVYGESSEAQVGENCFVAGEISETQVGEMSETQTCETSEVPVDDMLEVQINENYFVCELCQVSFTHIEHLKEHMQYHILPVNFEVQIVGKLYPCEFCNESFCEIDELKEHVKVHTALLTNNLGNQKLTTPSSKKWYSCGLCDKSFPEVSLLKGHIRIHTQRSSVQPTSAHVQYDQKRYSCGLCDNSYPDVEDLKQHIRVHVLPRYKKQFVCKICNQAFIGAHFLNAHLKTHGISEMSLPLDNLYPCGLCEEAFACINDLSAHVRDHYTKKPYACFECDLAFSTLLAFNQHCSSHKTKYHKCLYCNQSFTNSRSLKLHLTAHKRKQEDASEVYTCNYYEVLCHIKKSRKEESSPDGAKELTCLNDAPSGLCSDDVESSSCHPEYCRQTFSSYKELKSHLRTHTGEKPYCCDYCTEAFAQKKEFLLHLETHMDPIDCWYYY